MPYADIGELKLYYEEYEPAQQASSVRDAAPLVFLHGFTLDRRLWQPQVDYFRRRYRVIVPDSRGHGLSDAPESGYSRAHRAEDLHLFVQALGIPQFHLIGLSMGGSTGIGYALKYQNRLASLTLVATGAAGYGASKKISVIDRIARENGAEAAHRKWMDVILAWYKRHQSEIRRLLELQMREHSGAVWRDPERGRYPRENDLEQVHMITVPTMILVGSTDSMFLPLAKLLHKRMPHSKLSIFEGVGHMVNLEAPDRFNHELGLFLDSVTPGGSPSR